jgi:hypothetical protein
MSLPKTDYPLLESWASFCHMKNASFNIFQYGVTILNNDGEYFLNLGFPSLFNAAEKIVSRAANAENN